MKAVRFHEYGGIDVLRVEEVPRPVPGPGQVLVEVRAAGIQPGEVMIREGARHDRWPATFPSGQGSDLAGGGNIDAFIDTFGDGYVQLAVELGVRPERINTIRDWQAAARIGARTYGKARRRARSCSASWPGSPRTGNWTCRSPAPTRWSRCEMRSASWNAGTPTARSCSGPSPGAAAPGPLNDRADCPDLR